MRFIVTVAIVGGLIASNGCSVDMGGPPPGEEAGAAAEDLHWLSEWRERQASNARGEEIWFDSTFGGEKFFAFLKVHPDPSKRIDVGFEQVLNTRRSERFDVWGVINDPDCEANPAGGMDICDDPRATGVVGIRQTPLPDGSALFGVTCASCHAGFDPVAPPANPNEPTWDNIHPTIGNLYLKAGNIFAVNLPDDDLRKLMFSYWNDGTVDTTALFNDGIMNPGTVTAFWNHPFRPTFDNGTGGEEELRNGQGGEDDMGGDIAALRVYTNIGVCFQECVLPAVVGDRPISMEECRATCADFPTQDQMDDMGNFLGSIRAPQYRGSVDFGKYARGRGVFEANCSSCHDSSGWQRLALSNDEVNAIGPDDPSSPYTLGSNPQSTNTCRIRTSNWEEGKIWAEFSSPVYKDRVEAGGRGHRTMPLVGIWSTSPFMHNNSIGVVAPADATPDERVAAFEASMQELLSTDRVPQIDQLPPSVTSALGLPPGSPADLIFSRDQATGEILCLDPVENRGHYFGADLSDQDKAALIEWLKFQ